MHKSNLAAAMLDCSEARICARRIGAVRGFCDIAADMPFDRLLLRLFLERFAVFFLLLVEGIEFLEIIMQINQSWMWVIVRNN